MRTLIFTLVIAFSNILFAAAQHVSVRVHSLGNYGVRERAYALQSAQVLEQLINSGSFREKLLHLRYISGENAQSVYDAIIRAREVKAPYLDSTADNVIDMWLRLDATDLDCNGSSIGSDDGVGGYTKSCPNRIQCWAANNCVASMAGHMMHEYMHQLGYRHPRPFKTRKVPYVVGNAVVALLTDPQGEFRLTYCADWPANDGPCEHEN